MMSEFRTVGLEYIFALNVIRRIFFSSLEED